MNSTPPHPRFVYLVCAALALSVTVVGRTAETVDFDPNLLLSEDAPPASPTPAPAPQAGKPTRPAAPATPNKAVPTARTESRPEATLAPLDGELLSYVQESTSHWQLRNGESLRTALSRWSSDAGWTLVWKASREYRIEAPLNLPAGTPYKDAVKAVVRAVWRSNPSLHATVYGNHVLVIEDGKDASQ